MRDPDRSLPRVMTTADRAIQATALAAVQQSALQLPQVLRLCIRNTLPTISPWSGAPVDLMPGSSLVPMDRSNRGTSGDADLGLTINDRVPLSQRIHWNATDAALLWHAT